MGDIAEQLKKDLKKIGDKNKSSVMRIPFLSGFVDDIVAIFEKIVDALDKIENKIDSQ